MLGQWDELPDLTGSDYDGYTVHFVYDGLVIMGSVAGKDKDGKYWITQFDGAIPIATISETMLKMLLRENAAYVPPKDRQ
jgi:hypothetical protein